METGAELRGTGIKMNVENAKELLQEKKARWNKITRFYWGTSDEITGETVEDRFNSWRNIVESFEEYYNIIYSKKDHYLNTHTFVLEEHLCREDLKLFVDRLQFNEYRKLIESLSESIQHQITPMLRIQYNDKNLYGRYKALLKIKEIDVKAAEAELEKARAKEESHMDAYAVDVWSSFYESYSSDFDKLPRGLQIRHGVKKTKEEFMEDRDSIEENLRVLIDEQYDRWDNYYKNYFKLNEANKVEFKNKFNLTHEYLIEDEYAASDMYLIDATIGGMIEAQENENKNEILIQATKDVQSILAKDKNEIEVKLQKLEESQPTTETLVPLDALITEVELLKKKERIINKNLVKDLEKFENTEVRSHIPDQHSYSDKVKEFDTVVKHLLAKIEAAKIEVLNKQEENIIVSALQKIRAVKDGDTPLKTQKNFKNIKKSFSDIKQSLLNIHPWPFATKLIDLKASSSHGDIVKFKLPDNTIRVLQVTGGTNGDVLKVELIGDELHVNKHNFYESGSDIDNIGISIKYISDISDLSLASAAFKDALIWKIAFEFSYQVSGNTKNEERCRVEYERKLQIATMTNDNLSHHNISRNRISPRLSVYNI